MATSDHHRDRCVSCGTNVVWPNDEPLSPQCANCWDAAADADQVTVRRGRYPWTPDELASLSTEAARIAQSLPRGNSHLPGFRIAAMQELADRHGVSLRTVYRIARKAETLVPVEVNGRRAMFYAGSSGRLVRGTRWEPMR